MRKLKLKLHSYVIFFLAVIFSMRWAFFDYISSDLTQVIVNGIRSAAALSVVALFLWRYRKLSFSRKLSDNTDLPIVFVLFILIDLVWLFSTIVNHGDIKACFVGYLCPLIIVGLLIEWMRGRPEELLKGGMLLGEVLVYGNLLTVLLFPDGMYSTYGSIPGVWFTGKNWLLHQKNVFLPYFLFACLVADLYSIRGGIKKWREWSLYIACLLSAILVKSTTSAVVMTILIGLFLIKKVKTIKFNTFSLLSGNVALFFICVIMQQQKMFSFLIEEVLGKKITFSGRTALWDAVFPLIGDNLFLGLGIMKQGVFQQLTGFKFAMHAHNLILDYLCKGGLLCLVLYLAAMFFVYRKLHKLQNTDEAQACIITLFVFQIAALMEPYNINFVYMIYFISYYVYWFIPQTEPQTGPETAFIPSKEFKLRLGRLSFVLRSTKPAKSEALN